MTDVPATLPDAVRQRRPWWPGWIWSVPLAALGIVAWLAVRELSSRGPSVVVTFETAGGVRPTDTKVVYKDMVVGRVEAVALQPDLRRVDITLLLSPDLAGNLGPGTRFWIVGQNLSLSNLSALRTLLSGPYIGIDPRPGENVHHFTGLTEPPVLKEEPEGSTFVLHADRLNSASRGSPIYYRDIQVGELQGYKLADHDQGVEIAAFVQAPYDRLVRTGTRFWDESAVRVSMRDGPSLQMRSVPALFEGAIAFDTPRGTEAGPRSAPGSRFELYRSREAAENVPPPDAVAYRVTFERPAGTLAAGAPVELLGERIGSVRDSRLAFDTGRQALRLDAILLLDPERIALIGAALPDGDARARLDAVLRPLVEQGLRAQLASSAPLIGAPEVALRFVPDAAPAALGEGAMPSIPSSGSSDLQTLLARAGDVAAKIDAMPLAQIAGSMHQAVERLAQLSRSPDLSGSLRHLDRSLANLEQMTRETRRSVAPILNEMHRTVQQAESTLASAQQVLGNSGAGETGAPGTAALPGTLYELKQAARSLRELTDFLDRHPDALLLGRGG